MNRLRAKRLVALFPGIHLRKLQRVMNTSFNTTRYHVDNLERSGEIVCAVEHGRKRLYPAGFDGRAREVQTVLLDNASRKILCALLEDGTLGNAGISEETGLPKSTVSEHIETLRRLGLVKRNVSLEGVASYELQEREEVAQLIADFRRNLMASAADRFIDLWDF